MCEENWFWGQVYLCQVWGFCLVATVVTLTTDNKYVNAAAFIIAGYSTLFSMIHLAYYTSEASVRTFYIWPWLFGGILYAVGAIIYALKVPERLVPRTFDIWM